MEMLHEATVDAGCSPVEINIPAVEPITPPTMPEHHPDDQGEARLIRRQVAAHHYVQLRESRITAPGFIEISHEIL
jgi:hypothetical protein